MITNIFGEPEISLKGKIKNQTIITDSEIRYSDQFDEYGYGVQRSIYKNNKLSYIFKIFPDNDGWRIDKFDIETNSIPETIVRLNRNRNIIYRYGITYEYYDNNRIAKEVKRYESGVIDYEVSHIYFDEYVEITKFKYDYDGISSGFEKTVENYDEHIISKATYNSKGELTKDILNTYDIKGNLLSSITSGNTEFESFYEYDEIGNCIHETHEDCDWGVFTEYFKDYKFDHFGRIKIKITTNPEKKWSEKISYEYDNIGNLIKEEIITTENSLRDQIINIFEIEYYS